MILNDEGAVTEEEIRQQAVKARLEAYKAANFDVSGRTEYSLNASGDSSVIAPKQLQSEYCEAPVFKKKKKEKASIRKVVSAVCEYEVCIFIKDEEGFRIPEPMDQTSKSDRGSRNASKKVEKEQEVFFSHQTSFMHRKINGNGRKKTAILP